MNAAPETKEKFKPHFGIVLISLFYSLIALSVLLLFTYTYLTATTSLVNRIFGIILGFILGFSIFYIGASIWKGHTWAQLVVIVISAIIVLFEIVAYIIGLVVTVDSAAYLIAVLAINLLIIQYLFSRRAKEHFHKGDSFKEAITRAIKEHYEEHRSNNQE